MPNEGDVVKVPDPLPQRWWDQSADTLRECQKEAQLWYKDLYDYRRNKESVVTPTATREYDDAVKQSSKTAQTKATTMQ
eukprot:6002416-Pyramimonas_sp.AAC.1